MHFKKHKRFEENRTKNDFTKIKIEINSKETDKKTKNRLQHTLGKWKVKKERQQAESNNDFFI